MATPSRQLATFADLLTLPPQVVGEIAHGALHVSPRPAFPHAKAAIGAANLLGGFYGGGRGPGGWSIFFEPELHFGDDVLVPDLAGWRTERMPALPLTPYATLAPDWICEVLSPGTARFDRIDKMAIYARERVAHAWLIDPLLKTLEVYKLVEGRWTLWATHADGALVRAEPFDAVELELAGLWS